MNALEKFREYWKTLNDEERMHMWDLLAFIRGPDWPIRDDSMVAKLKNLTTCRVRALLMGEELSTELEKFITPKLEPNTDEELDEMTELMKTAPQHFIEHYLAAIKAIEHFERYKLLIEEWF